MKLTQLIPTRPRSTAARSAAAAMAVAAGLAAPTLAGTSVNTAGPVQQGQSNGGTGNPALNNPAVTISFAGQTALRGFNTSPAISLLQPGTSITLHTGPGGAPVTYYAPDTGSTAVQLAAKDFTLADVGVGATGFANAAASQRHSAVRLEWQEKGSLDGFYDLINDQVGYTAAAGPVNSLAGRGPSVSNPIWVNGTSFTAGATLSGHALAGGNGPAFYDTYANNASFGANQVYDAVTGRNLKGGQNRVQFAIGEPAVENFAFGGTPSPFAKPGQAGYGLGNPALSPAGSISGLGVSQSRQQFNPQSVANLSTDKADPQSAAGATYAAGPWNTAGAANIDSKQVAVTAVLVAANPGTGLSRLNLSDAQWLQTAGRLANGADFNTVSRVANTGQRNVLATNTGVDPTWAVGENDGGDTTLTANATAQSSIGPNLRFSGKTSGTFSRNAIAQGRMAVGALSLAETRGAASAAPVRALDVDFVDAADPKAGGTTDYSKFTRIGFDSFVNFEHKAILISHYNTVKAPNAAYAGDSAAAWAGRSVAETGAKGDPTGDVQAFLNNVTGSLATFSAGGPPASVGNPADGLLANGYFLPGLMNFKRQIDGGPLTPNPLTPDQQALQANIRDNYPAIFSTAGTFGTNDQTVGTAAKYGALGTASALNGSIDITAKDAAGNPVANGVSGPKGNYLFGNFLQNGTRDFAAVKESVNAALSLHAAERAAVGNANANNSIFTADGGVPNGTTIVPLDASGAAGWGTTAATKGDLVVLGDYNGDGRFDGRDVSQLARGASLADSAGADRLTTASGPTFADQLRNPNAVLRKNAALDYAKAKTADVNDPDQTFLRRTALSPQAQANDAANNYLNAFNKLDVDHNGKVDRNDTAIVDKFVGSDFRNLSHQLGATINDPFANTNQYGSSGPQQAFSLVDAVLSDGKSGVDLTDFAQVKVSVQSLGLLRDGDANFDGKVSIDDLALLAQNYDGTGKKWSLGDFTLDGKVTIDDLALLAQNYNLTAPSAADLAAFGPAFAQDAALAFAGAGVPEPGAAATLAVAAVGLLARRRRSAR